MDNKTTKITIKKDQVLCRAGDESYDLYLVVTGQLMVCSRSGKMVTPIAYLSDNEYFGEMSFIDKLPRSADVIAIEDTELIKIPSGLKQKSLPTWLLIMAKGMTGKVRLLDDVIRDKGIKRKNLDSIEPLTIDEQRHYYQLLDN